MTKYQKIEATGLATQYIIQDDVVWMRHDVSINSSFDENGVPFVATMISPAIIERTANIVVL